MPEAHDPNDRLEADLRRLAAAAMAASDEASASMAAPGSASPAATVVALPTAPGRRFLSIAASLLAVLVLGAGALALSTRGTTDSTIYTTPGSSPGSSFVPGPTAAPMPVPPLPPFEDPGPVVPWLNTRSIPTSGGDVVIVLRNTGTERFDFGVGTGVEVWNGESWTLVRKVEQCLDSWHCQGKLQPADQPLQVRAIGLSVAPGGISLPLFVRIDGLSAGWYRFGPGGEFEVSDNPEPAAPIGDVRRHRLQVSPALLPEAGGRLTVTFLPEPSPGEIVDLATLEGQVAPGAELQRWTGSGWMTVRNLELVTPPSDDPVGNLRDRVADVGALEPGAYRVLRHLVDGGDVEGIFWVPEGAR